MINSDYVITTAAPEHAAAIRQVYASAQINPSRFLKVAELASQSPVPADLGSSLGGFISAHDERDMAMTLAHGVIIICLQQNNVVAYNRYLTDPETVYQEFCAELKADHSKRVVSPDNISDWSGAISKKPGITLKQVCWTDKQTALLAFNAALAGLQGSAAGKLAWNVDTAVHPGSRKQGIPEAIQAYCKKGPLSDCQFRCFRIFEICKINDREICIENTRSKNTFVKTATRQFAYTEEEIVLSDDITLLVRWNYWLTPT